jgi:hypothetical protein
MQETYENYLRREFTSGLFNDAENRSEYVALKVTMVTE